MSEPGTSAERRPAPDGPWRPAPWLALVLGIAAVLLITGIVLMGFRLFNTWPWTPRDEPVLTASCPRPETAGYQPAFGEQQRDIRHLREQGFRGDFFAQLELGRRYEARRDTDRNLQDLVEAAVWYSMALTNPTGYAPVVARPVVDTRYTRPQDRPSSLYDDCRAFERDQAAQAVNALWRRMSSDEQQEVRRRVVYILYSQGATGFRTLARVTATGSGPYGEPSGEGGRWALPVELFPRNDVDAYLYSYLAAQRGDVGGYVLLKDLEREGGAGYADFVQAKANRWVPPYEFYPPEAPGSGIPHSDESSLDGEADEAALARLDDLPFVHIGQALAYLQVTPIVVANEKALRSAEIKALQAMLGRDQDGRLSAIEKVRAIQYAAVNGSSRAQLVLAVMYAEGVGVRTDYARAFYWFQRADRQGSGEAKFAIANYFSLGVEGVADQDKAKAVVYRLDSALAGFKPSADRIQAVLAQVSRKPRP